MLISYASLWSLVQKQVRKSSYSAVFHRHVTVSLNEVEEKLVGVWSYFAFVGISLRAVITGRYSRLGEEGYIGNKKVGKVLGLRGCCDMRL